ncbi:MAG: aromatic ring-hydroxylating dioxygenase subunit alpha [Candidatus Eisenbacteria bacterium]|nr:aromatic ring-hydroxylating dioxygenase subunit alpha [Candidatus Eisenbacteria bacterium]
MPPIPPFRIHDDIREAETLPAFVYSDPAVFARERERVFASSWQFITDASRVKVPGQVHPFTLLEGLLDEPLLFSRDRDDQLHCLSNVCTHRGNLVCEGDSVENGLRCRYHGRRFALDGRFQFMPEFEQAKGFPSAADDLPHVPFGAWENFLFASLRPAAPFDEVIREMRDRCAWMPLARAAFDPTRSREYRVRANWALYCDNFLEGFHIPFVHAGLAQAIDYGAYRTELLPWGSLQIGVAAGGEDVFDPPASSPDHGQKIAAYWFWIYPNTMFNFYPWGVSINVVRPLAADLTRVSFLSYVWDAARLDRGAGGAIDRVEREDEAIVESIQRGTAARLYTRGRYSPTREQGVHHFHKMLVRDLAAE